MAEKTVTIIRRDGRPYPRKVTGSGGYYQRMEGKHTYYPHPQKVDEMVQYLGTFDRPFSYTEVIESGKVNMARRTAHKVLVTLEEDGKIQKLGRGKYVYKVTSEDGSTENVEVTETVSQEGNDDDKDRV